MAVAKMSDKTSAFRFNAPNQDGHVALERCIRRRRSVREFGERALADAELGQLFWAAQGMTSDDGRRAVPSAGALYPLELYAVCGKVSSVPAGLYRYDPRGHQLVLVASRDAREGLAQAALGQDWIAGAPAVVCIAAVFDRTTVKYGNRGRGYVYMEAGHAAESLMLQAVALGLAATMVGAFEDGEVKRVLHLTAQETPLCLLPVGAPRSH